MSATPILPSQDDVRAFVATKPGPDALRSLYRSLVEVMLAMPTPMDGHLGGVARAVAELVPDEDDRAIALRGVHGLVAVLTAEGIASACRPMPRTLDCTTEVDEG